MTLEDLTTFLLEAHRDTAHPLTERTIVRCLLRAYEMGREDASALAPTRCVACGRPVAPRVQEKMYCSLNCKARLSMRRMRQRRAATSMRWMEKTP